MKLCQHCNQSIEDTASFCPYCGQKQEAVAASAPVQSDEREKAFYVFRRNLRHERKCWSIYGKVWVGFCIFFAAFALLFLMISVATEEPALIAMSLVYFLYPILLLPIAIINLVMANKISGYLDRIETDPNPAVERCGGVWLIVLSALFNNIALIFVILNFIHVKTHEELLKK
jgi:hypothetical protein